jgi:hypothetical protein
VAIKERDEDLANEHPYHLTVFFVVDETVWNNDLEGRAAVNGAFNEFVGALNGCDGIEVDEALSGVMSGANFSWQAAQSTDEWNFANLSHLDAK